MKKVASLILLLIICFYAAANVKAYYEDSEGFAFVVYNDTAMSLDKGKPFTAGGYTYVQDYSLKRLLGVSTEWFNNEKTLKITRGFFTVTVDERTNTVTLPRGKRKIMLYRLDDVLMVPLEPVAEGLCYNISYNQNGRILRLTNDTQKLTDDEIYYKYEKQIKAQKRRTETAMPPAPNVEAKYVFLTFDDGPSSNNTPKILDILKKYRVKATFFMLDANMKSNPDILKRMHDEGHSLGLHGITHKQSSFYVSEWSPTLEMERANVTLKSIVGQGTCLVRVPYGSVPSLTNTQYDNLSRSGFLMWDWNIDSKDSTGNFVSEGIIYKNTVAGLFEKKMPVVLFHDRTNVVNCLDNILRYLVQNGYKAVGISPDIEPYNWMNKKPVER